MISKHYVMKAYWRKEVKLHEFLIWAPDWGQCCASYRDFFTSREGFPISSRWEALGKSGCWREGSQSLPGVEPVQLGYSSHSHTLKYRLSRGMSWYWGQLLDVQNDHACLIKLTLSLTSVIGKSIPLQPWTGPEGSRRLRIPDFKTIGTWRW